MTVEAHNNSKENMYIQSAIFNGKPYNHNWLRYSDMVNGGILSFEMGPKPALNRGLAEEDKPFSLSRN